MTSYVYQRSDFNSLLQVSSSIRKVVFIEVELPQTPLHPQIKVIWNSLRPNIGL
jgi:hypothetical protein